MIDIMGRRSFSATRPLHTASYWRSSSSLVLALGVLLLAASDSFGQMIWPAVTACPTREKS
jgi:hypothetical protein